MHTLRKEFHGTVAPAIYTHHARASLVPDIDALKPHRIGLFGDAVDIGKESQIYLEISDDAKDTFAEQHGVTEFSGRDVYKHGFADRHFTGMMAGAIGNDISKFCLREGLLEEPLSLADHAKLYQTGWFGSMLGSMALAQIGRYQPNARDFGPICSTELTFSKAFEYDNASFFENTSNAVLSPYEIVVDTKSGLHTISLTREATALVHRSIPKRESVGCPVARTAFATTVENYSFLKQRGIVGEGSHSGFVTDESKIDETTKRVVLKQGQYTAIDDVLFAWGRFMNRYVAYFLAIGVSPEGLAPTKADEFLLLD